MHIKPSSDQKNVLYVEKRPPHPEKYMWILSQIETLEGEVGDTTETIDYSYEQFTVLPKYICKAARANGAKKILRWLGPLPVDTQRLNAKNPEEMKRTMMHCAMFAKNSDLLSILLQLGADVDPVAANGGTHLLQLATCWNSTHRRDCC